MQINIAGHQVEVGQSLQSYVKSKLGFVLEKFFAQVVDAKVIFEKHTHNMFAAEISIHELGHRHAFSKVEDEDIYKAFDTSLHKIEQQLRKHKEKCCDHDHHTRPDKE